MTNTAAKNKKRIKKYQKAYREKYGKNNIYGNRFIDKPHVQKKIQEAMKEQFPDEYYQRQKLDSKIDQEPNRLEQVVELNQQGLFNKDIANILGMQQSAVSYNLKRSGLERNRGYRGFESPLDYFNQYFNSNVELIFNILLLVKSERFKSFNRMIGASTSEKTDSTPLIFSSLCLIILIWLI